MGGYGWVITSIQNTAWSMNPESVCPTYPKGLQMQHYVLLLLLVCCYIWFGRITLLCQTIQTVGD